MIVLRPLGATPVYGTGLYTSSLSPALLPSLAERSRPELAAGSATRQVTDQVVETSVAEAQALRPQCADACGADARVAGDPESFSRCVSICSSTGDVDSALRNARAGSFCRQVLAAVGPSIGGTFETSAGRRDYQVMFERCQSNPDAFLGELRTMGIDLGVSYETWLKRNWKLVTIGGVALLGLLVIRKLRR